MTRAESIVLATGSYSGDDGNDRVQVFDVPSADGAGSWRASDDEASVADALRRVDLAQGGYVDGTMYVVGGEAGINGVVDDTQAYDLAANEWRTRQPMPTGVKGAADAVYDGKLYVFGGKTGDGRVAEVQIYDPEADEWTVGATLPDTATGVTTAVAVTDSTAERNGVYVFGGGADSRQTWRYDPADDSWDTDLADMPASRTRGGSAVCQGYVYLPAGTRDGDHSNRVVDRYDFEADEWDQAPQKAPYSATRSAMVVGDGESVYLIGGGNSFWGKESAVYRTSGDGWERLPDMRGGGADSAVVGTVPADTPDDTIDSVDASVTTLQFIPGEEEDVADGGHPLNSGLMHFFDESESIESELDVGPVSDEDAPLEIDPHPVLDSWYYGDQHNELPADLDEATSVKSGKCWDAVGDESLRRYRQKNGITVSFEVEDGASDGAPTIAEDTVEIEFSGMGERPDDDTVSFAGDRPPYSVLIDNEINSLPVEDWYGEFKRHANPEPRFYTYDTDFEYDGVEGVRVVTTVGGYVGFGADISRRATENRAEFLSTICDFEGLASLGPEIAALLSQRIDMLIDFLATIPRTWSLIEFVVLADGRRYARVWDASQYPSLATYLDGEREDFDPMPYEPRQKFNVDLLLFFGRAVIGYTPYQGSLLEYEHGVQNPDMMVRLINELVLDELPLSEWADEIPRVEIPRVTVAGAPGEESTVEDPSGPFGSLEFPKLESVEQSDSGQVENTS